jgi:hypothetical protein
MKEILDFFKVLIHVLITHSKTFYSNTTEWLDGSVLTSTLTYTLLEKGTP